jgi:hypothetical protein
MRRDVRGMTQDAFDAAQAGAGGAQGHQTSSKPDFATVTAKRRGGPPGACGCQLSCPQTISGRVGVLEE